MRVMFLFVKIMELQALLDTKKEYIELLCDVFGEAMIACFQRIYKNSMAKPEGRGKSVLAFFQEEVGQVATWNQAMIQDEFSIARKQSGCKYIADLIKAVLVTYVKISLVSNSNTMDSSKVKVRVPSAENFYHRCLLLFAREVWKQPYLMYHKVRSIELQQNLNELESIARKCIRAAIRNFVPMDQLVRDISLDGPVAPEKTQESSESESESEDEDESDSSSDDVGLGSEDSSESEYEQIVEQCDGADKVMPEPFEMPSVQTDDDEEDEVVEEEEGEEGEEADAVEKEIEIMQDDKRLGYDAEDPSVKDVDILSTKDEPEDPNTCDVDKVVEAKDEQLVTEEPPAQKKRIILGSMLINKHRNHKFIKPSNKKPGTSDAFF